MPWNFRPEIESAPKHIYVTLSGITSADLSKDTYYGVEVNGSGWLATVNLTPRFTYYDAYRVEQTQFLSAGQVIGTGSGGVKLSCFNSGICLYRL